MARLNSELEASNTMNMVHCFDRSRATGHKKFGKAPPRDVTLVDITRNDILNLNAKAENRSRLHDGYHFPVNFHAHATPQEMRVDD